MVLWQWRMSLGQCFGLLAAYERRHLWRAASVWEELGRVNKVWVAGSSGGTRNVGSLFWLYMSARNPQSRRRRETLK